MTIEFIDHSSPGVTVRSVESLLQDLNDAYQTIKELKIVSGVLIKDWSMERDVFTNRIKMLQVELEAYIALNKSYGITITGLRADCEAYRTEPPSVLQDQIDELIVQKGELKSEISLLAKIALDRGEEMQTLESEIYELRNRRD